MVACNAGVNLNQRQHATEPRGSRMQWGSYGFLAGILIGVVIGWMFAGFVGAFVRVAMVAMVAVPVVLIYIAWRRFVTPLLRPPVERQFAVPGGHEILHLVVGMGAARVRRLAFPGDRPERTRRVAEVREEAVTGAAGIAGILFAITGGVLWWRSRRSFKPRLLPTKLGPGPIVRHHRDVGLLTMPLLFAFFALLSVAIELRGAPWIGWIQDLSTHDPYYITPLLMGGTMFWQQYITPSTADPVQQKMMLIMPVVFLVMFLWAPSGLVLYWLFSNLWAIGQQIVTNRFVPPAPAAVVQAPAVRRIKQKQARTKQE